MNAKQCGRLFSEILIWFMLSVPLPTHPLCLENTANPFVFPITRVFARFLEDQPFFLSLEKAQSSPTPGVLERESREPRWGGGLSQHLGEWEGGGGWWSPEHQGLKPQPLQHQDTWPALEVTQLYEDRKSVV